MIWVVLLALFENGMSMLVNPTNTPPFLSGQTISSVTYPGILNNGWEYYSYIPGQPIGFFGYAGYSNVLQNYAFGRGLLASAFFPSSWVGPFTGNTVATVVPSCTYEQAFAAVQGSGLVNTSYPSFKAIPEGTLFGWSDVANRWLFQTPTTPPLYYSMTFNANPGLAASAPYQIHDEHIHVFTDVIAPSIAPSNCTPKLSVAWNPTTYVSILASSWMHYRFIAPTVKFPLGYFSYFRFPSFIGQQQPGQNLNGKIIEGEGRMSLYNFGPIVGPFNGSDAPGSTACATRPGTCTCSSFNGVWSQISGLGQLLLPMGPLPVGTEFGWSHDSNHFVFKTASSLFYNAVFITNPPFNYPYTSYDVSPRRSQKFQN